MHNLMDKLIVGAALLLFLSLGLVYLTVDRYFTHQERMAEIELRERLDNEAQVNLS
jgi:hypothetical protein